MLNGKERELASQIAGKAKVVKPDPVSPPIAQPCVDSVHLDNTTAATSALDVAGTQISGQIQRTVGNAVQYAQSLQEQRGEVIEQLSDRIAYLTDERTFLAEVFDRTAAKLGNVEALPSNPFAEVKIEVPTFRSLLPPGNVTVSLPASVNQ